MFSSVLKRLAALNSEPDLGIGWSWAKFRYVHAAYQTSSPACTYALSCLAQGSESHLQDLSDFQNYRACRHGAFELLWSKGQWSGLGLGSRLQSWCSQHRSCAFPLLINWQRDSARIAATCPCTSRHSFTASKFHAWLSLLSQLSSNSFAFNQT